MSLKEIKEGELKNVFNDVEAAFTALDIDFYIIGAIARDIWYARGEKNFRATRDIDFAVLVGSQEEYIAVRSYLKEHSNFQDSTQNAFVMIAPGNIEVDILPFGEIAIDDSIILAGPGLTSIKVNGFSEVYEAGTKEMEMVSGHHFKVATLCSIVLLKLIAFDDRPERRSKDPRDIANIINHFFDLHADLIYSNHVDLFADHENDGRSLQDISSIVIGREIKGIAASNKMLLERLQQIVISHLEKGDESIFIKNMVAETNKTVEECLRWLMYLLSSLGSQD